MSYIVDMKDWDDNVPTWWNSFFYHVVDSHWNDDRKKLLNEALVQYKCKLFVTTSDHYYKLEFETEEDYNFFRIRTAMGWNKKDNENNESHI